MGGCGVDRGLVGWKFSVSKIGMQTMRLWDNARRIGRCEEPWYINRRLKLARPNCSVPVLFWTVFPRSNGVAPTTWLGGHCMMRVRET